jgi:predicted transcriptional regulator
MLTSHGRCTYLADMEQMQPAAMSRATNARDRVDSALSRLESMVDERLRAEAARCDDLARRLSKLERQHDELKKVAMEVEGRLERAMEYIRSLLAADQQ